MSKQAENLVGVIKEAKDLFGEFFNTAKDTRTIEFIPTEFKELNKKIFVCGGLPRGRAVEIAGNTHTGKSTFCNWIIGEVQKQGGTACLFENEGAFDPHYATDCGVDIEKLIKPKIGYGEDALHKIKMALASNIFDVIVVDSQDSFKSESIGEVTARSLTMNERMTRPKMWTNFCQDILGGFEIKDLNGNFVKSNIKCPKRLSTGKTVLKNTIHKLEQKKTCLIIISHLAPTMNAFGKPEESTGGRELKYLFCLRLWLKGKKACYKTVKKQKILSHYELKLAIEKSRIGYIEGDSKLKVKMTVDGKIQPLTTTEEEEASLFDEILKGDD